MSIQVADTSRVDVRAQLADEVVVGPGCVIGPEVTIGRGTRLIGHVCLMGATALGEYNTVGPFVAIGGEPQDVSTRGPATRVEIGDGNAIAQGVTIHRATEKEDGITRIGSRNRLMPGSHVAHDCKLGDGITLGAGTMLAGHVHIEDDARLSEGVAVLQFVTVGTWSFVVGQTKVGQDAPPYMIVEGNPATIQGVNARLLKRAGFDGDALDSLREAHRLVFGARLSLGKAAEALESADLLTAEVVSLIRFLEAQREGRRGRARDRRPA